MEGADVSLSLVEIESLIVSFFFQFWEVQTDYKFLPNSIWDPVYQPVLVTGPNGPRVYFAGGGGVVYYRGQLNSQTAT